MNKKIIAIILVIMCCFTLMACSDRSKIDVDQQVDVDQQIDVDTTEEVITYSYAITPMLNADCDYRAPTSDKPGRWAVSVYCPDCGDCTTSPLYFSPEDLDFTSGDTILYDGRDMCYDCSSNVTKWFTWTLQITRKPK